MRTSWRAVHRSSRLDKVGIIPFYDLSSTLLSDIVAVVTGKSERRRVRLGQKYKLTDWSNSAVITDNSLPRDALGFYNGVPAAPVIFMSAGETPIPSTCFIHF